ncbi:MAG: Concanavalin A-like lectin/glucanase superfamily [Pseudomonadota bacterium]
MFSLLSTISSANLKRINIPVDGSLSGSVGFNGSSYLNNTSTNISLGTAWTMEAWIFLNTNTGAQCFFNLGVATNYVTHLTNDGGSNAHSINFTNFPAKLGDVAGLAIVTGQWVHIAIVRRASNGLVAFYLNGVLAHTTTQSALSSYSDLVGISLGKAFVTQSTNNFYVANGGRLASFRVSNNERYTTAFTPSKQQFVEDANTLLAYNANSSGNLTCTNGVVLTNINNCTFSTASPNAITIANKVFQFNGESFTGTTHNDAFGSALTASDYNTSISTVDKKDGLRSYYFNGTVSTGGANYKLLSLPDVSGLTTNGISISFWCKKVGNSGGDYFLFNLASGNFVLWGQGGASTLLNFFGIPSTGTFNIPSLNVWHHIAITVTSANVINIYVNGALVKTNVAGQTGLYATAFSGNRIGGVPVNNGGFSFNGYVDNFCMFNKILTQAEVTSIASGSTIQ